MKFQTTVYFLFAAILAITAVGCGGADGSNAPAETPTPSERVTMVETMIAEPEQFAEIIRLTGTVEASNDAVISAETAGQVRMIRELGSYVQQGEVVAQFDDRVAVASHNAARAAYELAEDTFQRQEALYRDSIISAIEFEGVRTQRDQARAQFEQTQKQLDDTKLIAPFSGRVEQRQVQVGELVSPGSPVVRIVNTNTVKIAAGVPERYAADIRPGTRVSILFGAYGGDERQGRVSFVGNVIDAGSRTFPVEVELSNPEGRYKPEMVADLSITRREIENAIVVPRNAIVRDETGPALFVLQEREGRSTVIRQAVSVGASHGGRTVIEEGIAAGDEVVIVGQNNVTEGSRVQVTRTHESLPETAVPAGDMTTAE